MLLVTSTAIVQDACAAFIVAPVTVMTPLPAVAVTTPVPLGQVEARFGAVATTTFAGNVSVKLIPDCAGFVPELASVKVRVEVAPWLIVAGAKAFVRAGATRLTTRHWSVTALDTFASAPMAAAPFVNAAAGQLAFTWPAALVSPDTVIVHVAVPPLTASPERVSTRVPATYEPVAGPEQPAEYARAGVVDASASPEGSVSVNPMPPWAGLPAPLARVNTSVVAAPSLIEAPPNALVRVACVTVSVWLVTPLSIPPMAVTCAAPFT